MDSFVQQQLKDAGLEELIDLFKEHEIDEKAFRALEPAQIEVLVDGKIGRSLKLTACLEKLRAGSTEATEAPPKLIKFADRPLEKIPPNISGAIDTSPLPRVAELVEVINNASRVQARTGIQPQSTKSINILLLGESGVGKSTWINAFTNYLKYTTFEEAAGAPNLLCPIPIEFPMLDSATHEYRTIKAGESDNNEIHDQGAAATQSARSYKFFTSDMQSIRLIDTPGICDPRGYDHDKHNLEEIMLHLTTITKLHGICILLQPNVRKISTQFQFCIKELLARLHKSAISNVVFCFTNTKSTDYEPGDTLQNLEVLLKPQRERGTEITLTKDTYYCMDNEAIRFLAASKCGMEFSEAKVRGFGESWDRSVTEIRRMIEHIMKLSPHYVVDTRKLNEARDIISQLSTPIAVFAATIQDNMNVIEAKREELADTKKTGARLEEILYFEVVTVNVEPTDPTIVCAAPGCCQPIKAAAEGQPKVNYKTRCHSPCTCEAVVADTPGAAGLRRCSAFAFSLLGLGFYCRHCKCSWMTHMRTEYALKTLRTQALDDEIRARLDGVKDDIAKKMYMLSVLQEQIGRETKERDLMLQISSRFANFLRRYAILPYNDAMRQYLKLCIKLEEGRVKGPDDDGRKLRGLRGMLDAYEEEIKLLSASDDVREDFNADAVQGLIEEAYLLPIYGEKLKEFVNKQKQLRMSFRKDARTRETSLRSWELKQHGGAGWGNPLQEWMKESWQMTEKPVAKPRPDKAQTEKKVADSGSTGTSPGEQDKKTILDRLQRGGARFMDGISGVKKQK